MADKTIALRTIAEFPITDESANMDAVNMRKIALEALSTNAGEAAPVAFDAFLCRAWGETDMPCAELVRDWDGVRRFMIREWLGEEDGEQLLQLKDDFDAHEEKMGRNGGPFAIEFEIGGVSVERVCGFGFTTPAQAAIDAREQEASTDAARDVLAERQRQISAEGWTPAHDDEHGDGSMAVAAAYYALGRIEGKGEVIWPWDRKWCKLRDERSNLVRAAALLLAEIERLDRAKARIRPDGFPTWICSRCTTPGYCSGPLQGCDIEEMNK